MHSKSVLEIKVKLNLNADFVTVEFFYDIR